jgi:RimJ/RimL family protein N-acetyltransferase
LGLRRVVWQASELNKSSRRLAERMDFRFEGILRWDRVVSPHRKEFGNGMEVRQGDPREAFGGRHSVILAHCWDDWEQGGRKIVGAIMARTA